MIKKQILIIKLNWVDGLTLLGLVFTLFGMGSALAGKFAFALSCFFWAMLADAMDGMLARHFNLTRAFGRYLDGFIDAGNYLIAPALFLYIWGFNSWYYVLVLIFLVASGTIRLAVFNEVGIIKENNTFAYLGMPVFWSIFLVGAAYICSWFVKKDIILPVLAVLTTIFSFLMIYNRNFFKFKSWKTLFVICISIATFFALVGFKAFNF